MASSAPGLTTPDFYPMSVAKMGFLVDQLNRDCSPLQFLRELAKNAVEAIQRLDEPVGEIRWDVLTCNGFDLLGDDFAQKLCVIDTGSGMTGPEMVDYINLADRFDFTNNPRLAISVWARRSQRHH